MGKELLTEFVAQLVVGVAEPQEVTARRDSLVRYEGRIIKEQEPCVDMDATLADTATGQILGTVDPPLCARPRHPPFGTRAGHTGTASCGGT